MCSSCCYWGYISGEPGQQQSCWWPRDIRSQGANNPWWRHQMETFSALLALYAGNSPVPGEFPTQRPVTRSFDVYFDLRPNKQSWGWWFETASWPLWRHRNAWLWLFGIKAPWGNNSTHICFSKYNLHHFSLDRMSKNIPTLPLMITQKYISPYLKAHNTSHIAWATSFNMSYMLSRYRYLKPLTW